MATAISSSSFPLATENPYTGADGSEPNTGVDDAGGASGNSPGALSISHGALVAIIVVVVLVGIIGIGSSLLFYLAKKREWKVRETIRKSARKVATALTPRRSEFPRHVKESTGRGRVRLDDVPPTPRLPPDLEKGLGGQADPNKKKKRSNFSRK